MSLEGFEVKPFDGKTREQYIDLCQYCFTMPETSRNRYFIHDDEFACSLGAWDGDRLACGMWYWPYDMRVRGQFIRMAGVAAVATWPEYRNRGLVRDLLARLQEQMVADKRPLSVLAPFKWSFYYDLGWAPTFETQILRFEPQKVARLDTGDYRLRAVNGPEEWQTFEEINMQASDRFNGPVCRSQDYWTRRMFEAPGQGRTSYLVESNGEARGYLIGRLDPFASGVDPEFYRVIQATWLDGVAQRAIFSFLGSLRDQAKRVNIFLPPDTQYQHCFRELYFEKKLDPKMMTKVVDLKPALEAMPFTDVEGSLTIEMLPDGGAPWNDGPWQLTFGGSKVQAEKGGSAADAVQLSPQALAQLYMGYRDVHDLTAAGMLQADAQQTELLARAFPRYPTFIDDWF